MMEPLGTDDPEPMIYVKHASSWQRQYNVNFYLTMPGNEAWHKSLKIALENIMGIESVIVDKYRVTVNKAVAFNWEYLEDRILGNIILHLDWEHRKVKIVGREADGHQPEAPVREFEQIFPDDDEMYDDMLAEVIREWKGSNAQ